MHCVTRYSTTVPTVYGNTVISRMHCRVLVLELTVVLMQLGNTARSVLHSNSNLVVSVSTLKDRSTV